ncbi:hypothetical protein MF271_22050 (plasmid) [Deinococcus sp. KNUC1210]|uniref:hypothetical protein n=1 Tax=Deinococcus sp. KNUC1210 TaxID=2917691 RepID=UPI001EF12799|nr:hypothetical protein [Deinococcus sp. KNUC1210]ULH18163.1 hypothetical protein MF271_22050 [Deinococcus sp. KNUC1210]
MLHHLTLCNAPLWDVAAEVRVACPKIRACLRWLAARHHVPGRMRQLCHMAVLHHHRLGKIAQPDVSLITELRQDCLQHDTILVGPLGGLFERCNWTAAMPKYTQRCLNALEQHLQRAVVKVAPPGMHPDTYLITTGRVLIDIAKMLTPPVMPAFWNLVFRLPSLTSQLLIDSVTQRPGQHPDLIRMLTTHRTQTSVSPH